MARIFLAMNGKRINTLDDLRVNFNGKQMLDFFRAGRLQKWLEEQQENDLLETLQDFQKENYDDETLLSMLMAAIELDNAAIDNEIENFTQEKREKSMGQAGTSEPVLQNKPESDSNDDKILASTLNETNCQEKDQKEFSDVCPVCKGHMRLFGRKCEACNGNLKNAMADFLNGFLFHATRTQFSTCNVSVKEKNFLAIAIVLKNVIQSAVQESDLSSNKRAIGDGWIGWKREFENEYGKDAYDIGIYDAVKKTFGIDYLRYSYSPKDILESLLLQSFPEMLDEGDLRPRYEELLP